MARSTVRFLTTLFLSLTLAPISTGQDWPRFRGPNGSGVSQARGLPTEFGPEKNVVWKIDAGQGGSSPILAAGRLYFTSFADSDRTVQCLNADTGETLWNRSVQKARDENASPPNGPATCTPVTDGEYVVAFFPDASLVCYSVEGEELWRAEVGPFHSMHGIASSPMIVGDKVLIVADQLKGSYLAAFQLKTGKPVWRVPRLDGLTGAYSTPSMYATGDDSSVVVVSGPQELVGYDSRTGEVAWSVAGATNAPVTLPVVSGNRVFVCEPVGTAEPISMLAPMDANKDGKLSLEEAKANVAIFRLLERMDNQWGNGDGVVEAAEWDKAFGGFVDKGGLVAIDVAADNQSATASVRWKYGKSVPYVPSVLVFEGVLYFVQDGGIVAALDADKGEVLKRGRLTAGGRKFYSSPVAADGKVYLVDTSGTFTVLRSGADWEELAVNKLGEPCYATPALGEGCIFVRTEKALYCFGKTQD